MKRLLALIYGAVVYSFFLVTFCYAIGFVGNLVVPKSIDTGSTDSLVLSLLIDAGLLGLFAGQHSIMARPAFKRWWTLFVPKPVERATFVLFASLALALLLWQWRPITTSIWHVTNPVLANALFSISLLGWTTVLVSTFLINHFELFGLVQVYAFWRARELPRPVFRTPALYRWVRHPIYLGFLLAFWATPTMTGGHLLFAIATTGYILLGIFLEERDLIAEFGEQYRRYRSSVGMLWPSLFGHAGSRDDAAPVARKAGASVNH
jgi:protein-S-isoprenylcysteine O-methyltransferase Ste14